MNSVTGLYYNHRRDYDPQTGRYIESDPIGLNGGGFSTYVYANANPISNSDPTGLASAADEARAMGLTSPTSPDCPRCQGADRWSYTPSAVCASDDAMCGIAMQAAGIPGPYYSTTHVVSRKCVLSAGLLVEPVKFTGSTLIGKWAPPWLARLIGLSPQATSIVSEAAAGLTSTTAGAIAAPYTLDAILNACSCSK